MLKPNILSLYGLWTVYESNNADLNAACVNQCTNLRAFFLIKRELYVIFKEILFLVKTVRSCFIRVLADKQTDVVCMFTCVKYFIVFKCLTTDIKFTLR